MPHDTHLVPRALRAGLLTLALVLAAGLPTLGAASPALPPADGALIAADDMPDLDALVDDHLAALAGIDAADEATRVLLAAQLATAHQARALGLDLAPTQLAGHTLPSLALKAWLADAGVAAPTADLAPLDALPAPYAAALARLIDAHAAVDAAARQGDTAGILSARIAFSDAVATLVRVVQHETTSQVACQPNVIDNPPQFFFELSTCNTGAPCVSVDYELYYDAGGDDTYCNNAGGTAMDSSSFSAASLVDVWGDDKYVGGDHGRTKGINGGGHTGSGYLFDGGGNDLYRAGIMGGGQLSAANGGGAKGGVGSLIESSGDDRYEGGWDGSNGGASTGATAQLLDQTGNDTYTGRNNGQAHGGINGGGVDGGQGYLYDAEGRDVYNAGSGGVNGGGFRCGGVGFLHDAAGNDRYVGRYAGVNGGGGGGTGHLRDDAGDDTYVTLGYAGHGENVNCAADGVTYAGSGLLEDSSGCDTYQDGWPGASGTDKTVVPKGNGAQSDAPAAACLKALKVEAGGYHTCVLTNTNNVDCYGGNGWGQANPKGILDYLVGDAVDVSAGGGHACVVTSGGDVDCWGWNTYGQANDQPFGNAVAVSAGWVHTCALLSNGDVECWGYNVDGQGTSMQGVGAQSFDAGYHHNCMVLPSQDVKCWGSNSNGQSQSYGGGNALGVSGGRAHTCVLQPGGTVLCYGWNAFGQANSYFAGDALEVDAGWHHTCARVTGGNVNCWGDNGHGSANPYTQGDAVQLSSDLHNCVLKTDGKVACWGYNPDGRATNWP